MRDKSPLGNKNNKNNNNHNDGNNTASRSHRRRSMRSHATSTAPFSNRARANASAPSPACWQRKVSSVIRCLSSRDDPNASATHPHRREPLPSNRMSKDSPEQFAAVRSGIGHDRRNDLRCLLGAVAVHMHHSRDSTEVGHQPWRNVVRVNVMLFPRVIGIAIVLNLFKSNVASRKVVVFLK